MWEDNSSIMIQGAEAVTGHIFWLSIDGMYLYTLVVSVLDHYNYACCEV